MNRKEEIALIEWKMKAGISQREIFRDLGATDDIATRIASTPSFDDRTKYSKLNKALVAILIYVAVAKIAFPIFNFIKYGLPLYLLPVLLFLSMVAIVLALEVKKFRGRAYMISGLYCLWVFLQSLEAYHKADISNYLILWSILNAPLVLGIFLGLYLKRKLCPYLGILAAKSNKSGDYLFLDSST